ncbi:MAG: sugar ABC transporter permease YjfF [Eubacteriales bacterium]|jgi:simple sugar transport system permease protein|nr:sugar ABC transporter permease YjfF [Eubacteriales bacterium]
METNKRLRALSSGKKQREPISNTNLLLIITVLTFFGMYGMAMSVWGGGFLNPQQFLDLFNNNSFLIVVACGLTIVMIAGGIDISVGGITALVTMACVVYLDDKGGSVAGSLALALGIGTAFGLVQGFLVSYLEIQPFIVSLAGMFFARGMTTIVSVAPRTAEHAAFLVLKQFRIVIPGIGSYGKTGNFIPARIELGVVIALAVVLLVFIVLKWTRFGRNLYAIGGNNQSALMLGINVKRTRFFSYLLSGVLSGIGGYVYLLHTGAGNASNASAAEMQAIASAIIGGTLLTGGVGNVIGTLFGVLSLKTINNIVIASGLREPYWQSITTGLMLCFFILLQSVILKIREGSGSKRD